MTPLNEHVFVDLMARISAAGRELPDSSMKCVDWHKQWGAWRVLLPRFCGGGQSYFSPLNYGGVEAALIEAQYFRDEAYHTAGVSLHARIRPTKKRRERGQVLPITEIFDARRNHTLVVGYWMETIDGVSQQRKVRRVIGPRSYDEAWAEVTAIVQSSVAAETLRRQALAAKLASGLLGASCPK